MDVFYPDEMITGAEQLAMFGAGTFLALVVYLLFWLFVLALSVTSYVFQSISLHTIAKRRGIRNGWLAWLPIGNLWIIGSISDQYQYVAKGNIKNRRKLLMGLEIGLFVAIIVWLVILTIITVIGSENLVGGLVIFVLAAIFGYLAIIALAIASAIISYMCIYDLYSSCNPSNGVLFLVLSIVFNAAMPFLIFACRKKDLGMPPRKQPASQTVVEAEVVEEPATEIVVEEGFAQPEEFED